MAYLALLEDIAALALRRENVFIALLQEYYVDILGYYGQIIIFFFFFFTIITPKGMLLKSIHFLASNSGTTFLISVVIQFYFLTFGTIASN